MIIFLIIFIGVLLIAFYNTFIALCIMLAIRILIPSFVKLPIISLSLNAALCLSLLTILIFKLIVYRKKVRNKTFFYPYIIGYTLFLLSLVFIPKNLSINIQLGGWMKTIYLDFIPPLLICLCVRNTKQIKTLLYVLFGSISIAGIYGIISYIIKLNPYIFALSVISNETVNTTGMLTEIRGVLEGRTQGTLSHPLVWGQIINIFFCFVLLVRFKIKKTVYYPLFFILFLNIILCGSRSILLASLLGFAIVLLEKSTKKICLYSIIGLLILHIGHKNNDFKPYLETIEASIFFWDQNKSDNIGIKGSSVELRENQLAGSFLLIKNNFFTGIGQGWIENYQKTKELHPIMLGFESVVYRKLIETGIIGFIAWSVFYLQLYNKTRQFMKKHKAKYNISIYFIPYLTSLIMTDSFESFYLFLILIILLCKYQKFTFSTSMQNRINIH